MERPFSIEATLDRFDGDNAVLRTNDGQELTWPANQIPDELEEGSVVQLAIVTQEASDEGHPLAQDILNEILGDEE